MLKKMDHAAYQAKLKNKSFDELAFIIKDAGEAEKANPQGENSGYYADEVHYASAEIRRRQQLRSFSLATA
jgi:hypothetical protein